MIVTSLENKARLGILVIRIFIIIYRHNSSFISEFGNISSLFQKLIKDVKIFFKILLIY